MRKKLFKTTSYVLIMAMLLSCIPSKISFADPVETSEVQTPEVETTEEGEDEDEDYDEDFKFEGWDDKETQKNTLELVADTDWETVIDENAYVEETTGSGADGDDNGTPTTTKRQKVLKDYLIHTEPDESELMEELDIDLDDDETAVGLRAKLVKYAKKFVGNPYVWGGNSLTNGVDCSGFVIQVYKKFNLSVNERTAQNEYNGSKKIDKNSLKPGDLVFYGSSTSDIGHVAIYTGKGKIVHAKGKAYGITTDSMDYSSRNSYYGRYIDDSKYPSWSDEDVKYLQCAATYAKTKQSGMKKKYSQMLMYTLVHQAKQDNKSIKNTCKDNVEAWNYGVEGYSLSGDTTWSDIESKYPNSIDSTVKSAMSDMLDGELSDNAKKNKQKYIYWYPYQFSKDYGIHTEAKNGTKSKAGCFFLSGLVVPDEPTTEATTSTTETVAPPTP